MRGRYKSESPAPPSDIFVPEKLKSLKILKIRLFYGLTFEEIITVK
jgi:hypothetical protein